jgi:hypothetical protein
MHKVEYRKFKVEARLSNFATLSSNKVIFGLSFDAKFFTLVYIFCCLNL